MGVRIRVRLEGPDAHLGVVPAADVAHMLLGIERVVARASATLSGGSATHGSLGRPDRERG